MTAGRVRTGILISGRGTNMSALIEAARDPAYPADIALVLSSRPDAAGLVVARNAGIPAIGLDHRCFASREAFDGEMQRLLVEHRVELVACAGFMRLMSAPFVEAWDGRMINIHPSLLPLYKGLDTHRRALADGVRIHGCTVHYVVPELDAGAIVAQAAVPVAGDDTPETLAARVLQAEHRLYPMALGLVARGKAVVARGRVKADAEEALEQTVFSPAVTGWSVIPPRG